MRMREEERRPYREAVSQLGKGKTGGIIELEEGENPRLVMLRMHRAPPDKGVYPHFQHRGVDQRELRFRLPTPAERRLG